MEGDTLELVPIFGSIYGKQALKEVKGNVLGDNTQISLGVKAGHILNINPVDDVSISKWIEEANPKVLDYISCDSKRFNKLARKVTKTKKQAFKQLVKGTINNWKEKIKKTFNIGSQMRRKQKVLR